MGMFLITFGTVFMSCTGGLLMVVALWSWCLEGDMDTVRTLVGITASFEKDLPVGVPGRKNPSTRILGTCLREDPQG